jgi:hypothetical protein
MSRTAATLPPLVWMPPIPGPSTGGPSKPKQNTMRHWQTSSTESEGSAPRSCYNTISSKATHLMALFSQATDLQTRSTVWVSRNVVKGRPQLNSHRDDIIGRGMESDGLPAAELANLHTPFVGWQGPGHQHWCNPEAKRLTWIG